MMEKHYPMPIAELEKTDKQFFEMVKNVYDLAMTAGELDIKTKVLITLALDASLGANAGVRTLATTARRLGITDTQIAETLRIAYVTSGMGTLVASRSAFEEK
jgi:alkylhydroperoxidase/carboxymuconolactone decarboxylase family protein YurZ